jgi:hypothetical protein
MGKLVLIVVALAVVWSGWWLIASSGLDRRLTKTMASYKASGWQIGVEARERLGFPTMLHTRLTGVSIAPAPAQGSQTGLAASVAAPRIDISALPYWPSYATVSSPVMHFDLAAPGFQAAVKVNDVQADLRLRIGWNSELESFSLTSNEWEFTSPVTGKVGGQGIEVTAVQQDRQLPIYDVKATLDEVTPDAGIPGLLGLSQDWSQPLDIATADLTLTFDRPWGNDAPGTVRPQPRVIDLHRAELAWRSVAARASGTIAIAEDGVLTGTLSLEVDDWPTVLDMASNAGYLPADFRPQAEQMLKGLAQMSGKTTGLDLTISITDGQMAMGFIPLGQAPRIILR